MEHERGQALGNMIVAARSAAAFYSVQSIREAWTNTFVRGSLSDVISSHGPYREIHKIFPRWAKAIMDFCVGIIPISKFTRMGDKSTTPIIRSREARNDGTPDDVANDIRYANTPEYEDIDARTWQKAVRHVAGIANDSYTDTDIKIEFERVYELDTSSGGSPLSTANFHHSGITTAESVKAIAPFGFLNRAAVFGGAEGSDRIHYKSYMYGSNVIVFDNDLTNYGYLDSSMPPGTDKRHLQRQLGMSDIELKQFISNIVTASGGIIENQVPKRGKRKHDSEYDDVLPPYEGCVSYTSFNKLTNSLQFTFNTQGKKHYFTANLLLLKADDFCTSDLVYRRAAISSLCQCERPVLVWRVCVLVTPINCATIDGASHNEVTKVVMAAFTAFRAVYQNKRPTVDSRLAVISAFLALPIAPFLDKVNRAKSSREAQLAKLCVFHRWLRAHSGSNWVRVSSKGLVRTMTDRGGRGIIVQRPILMTGTDHASAGKRSLLRFMTYEDSVRKVLRLTESSLMNGLSDSTDDRNCMVAYLRGSDLIVFQHADLKFGHNDDDTLVTAEEQTIVGGPSSLWRALFEAPSILYIDVGVLVTLGFNAVRILCRGGRTFEHADYYTGNECTVFCSILLRIVNDPTFDVLNERDDNITSIYQNAYTRYTDEIDAFKDIRVLNGKDNRFEANETANQQEGTIRSRFYETIHDVGVYWPGVKLVKTEFIDPELKHICFAYFTGDVGVRMGLENLHAFSEYCTRESLLPPPILYTLQKMALKSLYMYTK